MVWHKSCKVQKFWHQTLHQKKKVRNGKALPLMSLKDSSDLDSNFRIRASFWPDILYLRCHGGVSNPHAEAWGSDWLAIFQATHFRSALQQPGDQAARVRNSKLTTSTQHDTMLLNCWNRVFALDSLYASLARTNSSECLLATYKNSFPWKCFSLSLTPAIRLEAIAIRLEVPPEALPVYLHDVLRGAPFSKDRG